MALSDCLKCWNTPCSCGWDYRYKTIEDLDETINLFKKIKKFKEDNPNANLGGRFVFGHETTDDKKFMEYIKNESI